MFRWSRWTTFVCRPIPCVHPFPCPERSIARSTGLPGVQGRYSRQQSGPTGSLWPCTGPAVATNTQRYLMGKRQRHMENRILEIQHSIIRFPIMISLWSECIRDIRVYCPSSSHSLTHSLWRTVTTATMYYALMTVQ